MLATPPNPDPPPDIQAALVAYLGLRRTPPAGERVMEVHNAGPSLLYARVAGRLHHSWEREWSWRYEMLWRVVR